MKTGTIQFIHADSHRACLGCATAKTKCIPVSDGTTRCERCQRLEKECTVPPRQGQKRKKLNSSSALERKVDAIVAMLADERKRETPSAGGESRAGSPTTQEPASPPYVPPDTSFPDLGLREDECHEMFSRFLRDQARYSPWIRIPTKTTAASMRMDKPLLFLGIMMAASHHDDAQQQRISRVAMSYIAEEVIVKGEKNVPLLQGLLVLLSWYQSQFLVNAQLTNLLNLSVAMTTDLGLNQSHLPSANPAMRHFMQRARQAVHGPIIDIDCKSLADRRALLGCFYLSATFATSSPSLLTPMAWSAQLEEATRELSRSEVRGDIRLATLVRFQQITLEIYQMQRELFLLEAPMEQLSARIRPFEARLQQLWDEVPAEFRQEDTFILTYHITHAHLYKISLLDATPVFSQDVDLFNMHKQTHSYAGSPSPSAFSPRTGTGSLSPSTLDYLASPAIPLPSEPSSPPHPPPDSGALFETRFRCLQAVSSSLNVFFAIPPTNLTSLPLTFWEQIGLALNTLARLKLKRESGLGGNPGQATSGNLSFDATLERIARRLEAAVDKVAAAAARARAEPGCLPDLNNNRLIHWCGWIRSCLAVIQAMEGQGPLHHRLSMSLNLNLDTGPQRPETQMFYAKQEMLDTGLHGLPHVVDYDQQGQPDTATMMDFFCSQHHAISNGASNFAPYPTPEEDTAMLMLSDLEQPISHPAVTAAALETDWKLLLDDMCGYGLFGYSDEQVFQTILHGGPTMPGMHDGLAGTDGGECTF